MWVLVWDYTRPKHDKKAKLCYMDTYGGIVYVKTDHIYKDIAEDVENKFDNSLLIRQTIAKEENEKVLGWMKGESGEKNDDKTCWIKSKNL